MLTIDLGKCGFFPAYPVVQTNFHRYSFTVHHYQYYGMTTVSDIFTILTLSTISLYTKRMSNVWIIPRWSTLLMIALYYNSKISHNTFLLIIILNVNTSKGNHQMSCRSMNSRSNIYYTISCSVRVTPFCINYILRSLQIPSMETIWILNEIW